MGGQGTHLAVSAQKSGTGAGSGPAWGKCHRNSPLSAAPPSLPSIVVTAFVAHEFFWVGVSGLAYPTVCPTTELARAATTPHLYCPDSPDRAGRRLKVVSQLLFRNKWCPGADLNHRHEDFQSTALPLSYPGTGEGDTFGWSRSRPCGVGCPASFFDAVQCGFGVAFSVSSIAFSMSSGSRDGIA